MSGHRIRKFDGEEVTHERVVKFMRREHPGTIFRTDFAAGIKLPPWLAARQKRVQYRRGFPDIFIFKPVTRMTPLGDITFHGLALELKAAGVKLKLRDGSWASDHIGEQFKMLTELSGEGYACSFAVGYEEACRVIDWYLSGEGDLEFDDFIPVRLDSEVLTNAEEVF